MRNFWDALSALGFIAGIGLASVVIFVGVGTGVDYLECKGFAEATQAPDWKYNWGCYVKMKNDVWVPKDYVYGKVNEVRLEGK
jgi:hypothetical protein